MFSMNQTVQYIAAVAFLAFANTLHADFSFDDGFAIRNNKDVTDPQASFVDMWSHDFWGQRIAKPDSHKSYRYGPNSV
eukprot:4174762-Pyramimonas_sp.AAC.1